MNNTTDRQLTRTYTNKTSKQYYNKQNNNVTVDSDIRSEL